MTLNLFRDLCYLLAAVLFILGLKGLTHPRTAVRGNMMGATGMLIACVVTLLGERFDWTLIVIGLIIGSALGAVMALRVPMTAMPQMVALLNGFGGGASLLVAGEYLYRAGTPTTADVMLATGASGLIGAITLSGSVIAFGKLQELKFIRDVRFPGQQWLNLVLLLIAMTLGAFILTKPEYANLWYWLMALFALSLGVFLVISIGGADMPVVIALLNSYSGIAAAATGFVLQNSVLIVAGSLVGASGIILTKIMCDAMNRSLPAVLFGTMQGGASTQQVDEIYANVRSTTADEIAMLLDVCERVVIVPGYGMAVAQAQHAVRDLTNALLKRGASVEFGIHPVAGRMPGHMNVLLAEADIPYELQKEMDEINSRLDRADMCIVLGANDVVNPLARTDPKSPIAGMPIIEAERAKTVVVIKRSLSPGFAGIPNPLFAAPNTLMFYADGQKGMLDIVKAMREG